MKLLFIAPRYSGGIGGHAAMLADQLTDYGYEVTKMETPHIPIKNLKNPSFAVFGTLKGILSRENYDIVHAFNVPSAFAMHYAKGRKKVLSIHGLFSDQVKTLHSKTTSTIAKNTESKVLKWADSLTTDSQSTKTAYKNKLGFDFVHLPSAIDTSKLDQIPNVEKSGRQIIYLGRESYEKGFDIIKKIESKINGNIVYCTDKPWFEAMKLLKQSSILIMPSRMESLPTSIKEAFYLKIPVIATNVGGIPELVEDNNTGILVPSEDTEQLTHKINELLDNHDLRNKLTSAAFNFITNNMTWKKILPRYIEFYKNLLKS